MEFKPTTLSYTEVEKYCSICKKFGHYTSEHNEYKNLLKKDYNIKW